MTRLFGQIGNPVLLDRAFAEMNALLLDELPWLSNAFGRAYHVTELVDNQPYVKPAVYVNNKEYLPMLPSDEHGNFSFFIVDDPQEFEGEIRLNKGLMKAKFSLIFWLSIEDIFGDDEVMNTEQVKYDILKVITSPKAFTKGRITVTNVYERPDNVYKTFSLKDVNTNYLMAPYYGYRFSGEIMIKELC